MREIVTLTAVAVILISLAVEISAWAMRRWLGERWWEVFLGQPTIEKAELRLWEATPVGDCHKLHDRGK